MRLHFLTPRIVLAACSLTALAATAVDRPPNVVLIVSDDQGYADVGLVARGDHITGCVIASSIQTPSSTTGSASWPPWAST